MNDFVKNFCDILDDTDISTINGGTKFKEIEEWSSIIALSLIAMVDENYDITLGTDDIRNAETLQDLYDVIQKKCGC